MMGVSVYEFLRLGVPCLVIPRTQMDVDGLSILESRALGMVSRLRPIDWVSPGELAEGIVGMDHIDRGDVVRFGDERIRDDGARRIVEGLLHV